MQSAILHQGFALSRSAPQGFALSRSRSARARLESALGERISAPFTDIERRTLETVPTGIAPLDALMGGLPRGGITELFGPPSSGCTSAMISILAEATARDEVCALIERIIAVDKRAHLIACRRFGQNRNHGGCASRRWRAKKLGNAAARQPSHQRVQRSNSGWNSFQGTSFDVGKRRRNPFTECGL